MEADWICLATIKFRNPRLWDALKKRTKLPKANAPSNIANSGNIFSLIDGKLSCLKLSKPLLMQLDIVYRYLLDGSLRGNVNILRTFIDDIPAADVMRWYWPNYKLLATVSSLGHREKNTRRLLHCFQLLIVSFACFHPDESNFLSEIMIVRFIKSDLLAVKERQPKCISQFVPPNRTFIASFKLARMCKIHFDTLRGALNLHSQLGNSTAVSQAFDKICFVMECLTHVFSTHAPALKSCSSAARLSSNKSAFRQRYLQRSRTMSLKYKKELHAALDRRADDFEGKIHCLRIIIGALLSLVNNVHWGEHKRPKEAVTGRLNLQCALLVAGDLDLMSQFRLVRWPHWSVSLEKKDQ
ncbi:MEI4 (YER044C-A) [Zygosaccharomyces parabailii]|nr:MEI4 (YER044C-A) [Zygosaccharomyces parabailii]